MALAVNDEITAPAAQESTADEVRVGIERLIDARNIGGMFSDTGAGTENRPGSRQVAAG